MAKCAVCGESCGEHPILFEHMDQALRFCDLECLIEYSVAVLRRRISRQSRRYRNLVNAQRRCAGPDPRRRVRSRVQA